jgi:predicted nucleic acid-binding protein
VITEPVLLDTGPLVAILHESDQYHALCVDQAKQLAGPVWSCWPVVTEAAWLLRNVPDGLTRLFSMISQGDLTLLDLDASAAAWMDARRGLYESLRPQLADLCLLYLADRERVRHVFTLDRRDFSVYRDRNHQPFDLLPEVI